MNERKKEIEVQVRRMVDEFQERNIDAHLRVFVTFDSEGNSHGFNYGGGSLYAQMGYVQDWLEFQRARNWHDATREKREDGMGSF